jgi:hypothetical protein
VLAVSPEKWDLLERHCESENVEATVIGRFEKTGRLRLSYEGQQVADISMEFLHRGRPTVVREAAWQPSAPSSNGLAKGSIRPENPTDVLMKVLASPNVCSKEWIIRQYDHEVQGGSVIKPLVGAHNDGPSDAAVVAPVLGSWQGLAIGCGLNPRYGDQDPYAMAAAAIDEAVRNVVAVGADPARIALLDNFCWGNTDRPEVLGSLVRAAEACRDIALAFNMPFISGKDSLRNEYHAGDRHIVIPPTLLISALGHVPDVRRCVTMDLKEAGNRLYLIGATKDEMGGSHCHLVTAQSGGVVPKVDPAPWSGPVVPRLERGRVGGRGSGDGIRRRGRSRRDGVEQRIGFGGRSTALFRVAKSLCRGGPATRCPGVRGVSGRGRAVASDWRNDEGAAPAHRRVNRRVGRVGGLGCIEGGVAEAAAVVTPKHGTIQGPLLEKRLCPFTTGPELKPAYSTTSTIAGWRNYGPC